jgi:hypothetical protein
MPAFQGLGQSLVVSGESAESAKPPERSLHHPASRQHYEPTLGFPMLDHEEIDPFVLGLLRRLFAGAALIHIRNFNRAVRDFVNSATCARSCSFAAVIFSASRLPGVSTAAWIFDPFFFLAPS